MPYRRKRSASAGFQAGFTITIDPEDAKDFDDAISLRAMEKGRWEIGVHIADVSLLRATRDRHRGGGG